MTVKQQLRRLYNDTFGEDEAFDNALFEHYLDRCRYLTQGERVVSMLFELPCEIHLKGATLPARYVYAAATHPDWRGKGLMARLLAECKEREGIIILRPAERSLVDYYKRHGFEPFTAKAEREGDIFVTVDPQIDKMAEGGDSDGSQFTMMCCGCDANTLEGLCFAYSMQ